MPALKHTVTLPKNDSVRAVDIFNAAITDLGVVPMILIGDGHDLARIAGWADEACERAPADDGSFLRRVIWIRYPAPHSVQCLLDALKGYDPVAKILVLNFNQCVKTAIRDLSGVDSMAIEGAFLTGTSA